MTSLPKTITDPLLQTIDEYRSRLATYDRHPDKDEHAELLIASTYGPALKKLQSWEGPAATRIGAMEALRMAQGQADGGMDSTVASAMLKAALAYLESEKTDRLALSDHIHDLSRYVSILHRVLEGVLDRRVSERQGDYLVFRLDDASVDDIEFLSFEAQTRADDIASRSIDFV